MRLCAKARPASVTNLGLLPFKRKNRHPGRIPETRTPRVGVTSVHAGFELTSVFWSRFQFSGGYGRVHAFGFALSHSVLSLAPSPREDIAGTSPYPGSASV